MNWKPTSLARRVRSVPAHLSDLSNYLLDLSNQVKTAVAEVVGTTVSGIVRDSLHRLWLPPEASPPPAVSTPRRSADPYRWDDDLDVWDMEPNSTRPPAYTPSSPAPAPAPAPAPSSSTWSLPLWAMAIRAAGWWLQRRGSSLGALAVGLGIGALALLGGPIALVGLGVAEAASELIALNMLLTKTPEMLGTI